MFRRKLQNKKGFTLTETLIAVALAIAFLVVIVEFFLGYSKVFRYIEANFLVSNSASTIADDVAEMVRQSDKILTSRAFSGTTYTTGTSTIVLEIPTVNGSGSIVAGTYDYMVFYRNGAKFYWISDANGSSVRQDFTKQMTDAISSITFTYDAGDVTTATKVDIDVQTTKSVKSQNLNQHVHSQAYLRNI